MLKKNKAKSEHYFKPGLFPSSPYCRVLQAAEVTQRRAAESSSTKAAAQAGKMSRNVVFAQSQKHGLKLTLL